MIWLNYSHQFVFYVIDQVNFISLKFFENMFSDLQSTTKYKENIVARILIFKSNLLTKVHYLNDSLYLNTTGPIVNVISKLSGVKITGRGIADEVAD